jgi:uncharacterized protein (DUF433 family)
MTGFGKGDAMGKDYVTKVRAGQTAAYRIDGTRVSLDSIVYSWLRGDSPETITDNFPALTLEQVYGALAFYLAHQEEIDQYLRQGEAEYEQLRRKHLEQLRTTRPQLYQKLMAYKQRKAAIDSTADPVHQ